MKQLTQQDNTNNWRERLTRLVESMNRDDELRITKTQDERVAWVIMMRKTKERIEIVDI